MKIQKEICNGQTLKLILAMESMTKKNIVKNPFGCISHLFSASSVYYKSYRQVLTLVNNLQCLLRLPIFDKTRLAAFHIKARQRNHTNWFLPVRVNESANES